MRSEADAADDARTSDEELARRAQAGSIASFDSLVRRYQGRLLQYLDMLNKDSARAEDALQDTFLRAYQSIRTYRSRWRFSTWIYTIARRCHLKQQRSQRDVSLEANPVDQQYHDDEFERRETAGKMWETVRRSVNDDGFTALWMLYVDEASIAEIARVLGRSRSGTKMLLSRLRKKIRPRLARFIERDAPTHKQPAGAVVIRSDQSVRAA